MEKSEKQNEIKTAIEAFQTPNLTEAATMLLKSIGLQSSKKLRLESKTFKGFISHFDQNHSLDQTKAHVSDWKYIDFLFQITGDELKYDNSTNPFNKGTAESYLFFCLELDKPEYSRTVLSQITREINKLFAMPVLIIFKTGNLLTLSIINRRLNKKDNTKDVLEKITFIKDINIKKPHHAHLDILFDLSIEQLPLKTKSSITNFAELHDAWQKVLDTKELNKRFYSELSNWYFWAMDKVQFPDDKEKDREIRNATNLIRLITRIIFIWFIKEKKLVPDTLFKPEELQSLLKNFNQNTSSHHYYNAILQNLFFGTLNQKIEERDFISDRQYQGKNAQFNVTTLYRYPEMFNISKKEIKALFREIPFLNGGLFDCLDKPDEEDNSKVIRIDGFSTKEQNRAIIPDELFFGEEREVDLNNIYDTKGKTYKTEGLIRILKELYQNNIYNCTFILV